ncbi:hypothetical protein KI387_029136, partial [Taxus chinensis]
SLPCKSCIDPELLSLSYQTASWRAGGTILAVYAQPTTPVLLVHPASSTTLTCWPLCYPIDPRLWCSSGALHNLSCTENERWLVLCSPPPAGEPFQGYHSLISASVLHLEWYWISAT